MFQIQWIGIHFKKSCPHTSQKDGGVERKHRHITEIGLCMLFTASLPLNFWFHVSSTATFMINRDLTTNPNFIPSPLSSIFKTNICKNDMQVAPNLFLPKQLTTNQICSFLNYKTWKKGEKIAIGSCI